MSRKDKETPGAATPGENVNLPGRTHYTTEEVDELLGSVTGVPTVFSPVANSASQDGPQDGKTSSDDSSNAQAGSGSPVDWHDSTEIYLDGNASPTGYASTKSTSSTEQFSRSCPDKECVQPRLEALGHVGSVHAMRQKLLRRFRSLCSWSRSLRVRISEFREALFERH